MPSRDVAPVGGSSSSATDSASTTGSDTAPSATPTNNAAGRIGGGVVNVGAGVSLVLALVGFVGI